MQSIYHYIPEINHFHSFSVNDQRDTQFFSTYLFVFLTLYVFRAHRADHQERQIVSIQPVAYPGIFFGEGVQQIQLGTEDRQNGDLGAVAP